MSGDSCAGPSSGLEERLAGLSIKDGQSRQACASSGVVHDFATEPGDHAETPLQAYEHIAPLLERIATRLGVTKAALRIYDPFFCEGRMRAHMGSLGFESVYNRNEDFYAVRAAKRTPEFDVLVTNPPFSGDHIEETFSFAIASGKPFLILVPQYVARKAFYLEWLNCGRAPGTPRPVFLGPKHEPYVFLAPDRDDVRAARAPGQEAAAAAPGGAAGAGAGAGASDVPGGSAGDSGAGSAEAGPVEGGRAEAAGSVEVGAAEAGPAGTAGPGPAAAEPSAEPEPSEPSGGCTAAAEPAPRPSHAAAASSAATASSGAGGASDEGASSSSQEAAAAAAAAAFQVAAGSFQCVWFVGLGERHQKPVVEWWRQRHGDGAACVIVGDVKDLPVLTAVKKLTPAERRWRKKQAALAQQGQGQGGEGEPADEAGGAAAGSGRPGVGGGGRPGAGGGGRPGAGGGGRPGAFGGGRPGSHLELRRLRLLLPPLPGGAAWEGAILAWLLAGAGSGSGGGGSSVRLTGVSLVFASQADLSVLTTTLCNMDTWAHASVSGIQILHGVVSYSNGTMPLPYGDAAQLQDVSVTCSEGGGPQPPYACSATSVHNASELLAAANQLLNVTRGNVLLSLAANISLANPSGDGLAEGWGEAAVPVPGRKSLGLFGEPPSTPGAPPTRLDWAGAISVIDALDGWVVLRDLSLAGLSYPPGFSILEDMFAAWLHAVRSRVPVPRAGLVGGTGYSKTGVLYQRCTLALPGPEVAWWRQRVGDPSIVPGPALQSGIFSSGFQFGKTPWSFMAANATNAATSNESSLAPLRGFNMTDGRNRPYTSFWDCAMLPLEALAPPASAATPQEWPLLGMLGEQTLNQMGMYDIKMHTQNTLEGMLGSTCGREAVGSPTEGGHLLMLPRKWPEEYYAFTMGPVDGPPPRFTPIQIYAPDEAQRPWASGIATVSDPYSGGVELVANWSCGVTGGPAGQSGRRSLWDVRGASRLIVIPPSSPFALSNIVLYNLPPTLTTSKPAIPAEPTGDASLAWSACPPLTVDTALAGLSLALWMFDFDRSSSAGPSPLSLRNVTIVVPPAELSLLLGVLREAGRLPPSPGATPTAALGYPGSRRLAQQGRWLQQASQPPPPPAAALTAADLAAAEAVALSCPRALLSAYARASDVLSYNDTTVHFSTITFRGWTGTDVVVQSSTPLDAPSLRFVPDPALLDPALSPGLSTACSPPPSAPAPPPVPAAPPSPPPPLPRPSPSPPSSPRRPTSIGSSPGAVAQGPSTPLLAQGLEPPLPPLPPITPPTTEPRGASIQTAPADGAGPADDRPWVVVVAAVVPVATILLLALLALVMLARRRKRRQERDAGAGSSKGGSPRTSLALSTLNFNVVSANEGRSKIAVRANSNTNNNISTSTGNWTAILGTQTPSARHTDSRADSGGDAGDTGITGAAAVPVVETQPRMGPCSPGLQSSNSGRMQSFGLVVMGASGSVGPATSPRAADGGPRVSSFRSIRVAPAPAADGTPQPATPAAPGDVSLLGGSGSSIDGGQQRAGRDAADALDVSYLNYLMLRETELLNANASGAEEGQEARPRRIRLASEGISKRLPAFVPARGADAWAAAVESVQDEIAAAEGEANDSTGDAASSKRGGTELTLGAILGRGSFGSVYLGTWRGLPVAAKIQVVVDEMLGAEGRRRYRILLEAAIGTSLAHPNLVATYAYDIRPLAVQHGPSTEGRNASSDEDSILGIGGQGAAPPAPDAYQLITVQELCAGGSLMTALEAGLAGGSKFCGAVLGDPLAAAAAIHLAADVAAGLRHAHAAGIVHGDISSGNILLAARTGADAAEAAAGGEGEVGVDATEAGCRRRLAAAAHRPPVAGKVADFGLSVRMGADATHASGHCQGTPLYMAPEVSATGRISPASDAHAYGVLLLELILGDSARSMWRRQAAAGLGDAWKPSRLLDALPSAGGGCLPRLGALAEACLSQNPADRPTMDQVLERLSEAAEALAAERQGPAFASPALQLSPAVRPSQVREREQERAGLARLDEHALLQSTVSS
ncbi:hypothetical protein HYH03_006094 [Edaphochlamys debaryana]|uniref:Protein kinase domain-containing protein n=1 Tax=Edaphochlamys debaryana TaxID=47281 RepID=A0A835Y4J3_9CHLO|nr:hypothetical protein HYH03_006094 [Edaphochlamys debaryana]|eukprot:KAG2495856.1 hypothetical protein HYH03_006094 [Edaphochlamys debaryana]